MTNSDIAVDQTLETVPTDVVPVPGLVEPEEGMEGIMAIDAELNELDPMFDYMDFAGPFDDWGMPVDGGQAMVGLEVEEPTAVEAETDMMPWIISGVVLVVVVTIIAVVAVKKNKG